jgi:L-2,4-diaminobutyrate decarboxylase
MYDTTDVNLAAARSRIRAAYDPAAVAQLGQRLASLLGNHLRQVESSSTRVLNWTDPRANFDLATSELAATSAASSPAPPTPDDLTARFADIVTNMLARGQNLHDPRYVGHQVPASIPIAGWFDAVGAVTNQVMAIYEMGPWATSVEQALVTKLGGYLGWQPGHFAGVVTHGASLANLTGLLAARNVTLGDAWERGLRGHWRAGDVSPPVTPSSPVLVTQQDAHYSVARAAGILGIGTANVIKVGQDSRRRMDPAKLLATLTEMRSAARPIIAVVASACATPIGAFDPLDAVADVCAKQNVWLHVDAAHGGSALLSPRHRHLVGGLERADSLVWDAHKMMFVPALCAFLLYKNPRHSYEAFRQNAPYLFDPSAPGLAEFDSGLRTVECTKRAASFGLWGAWSLFGPQLFTDLVDVTFDLGRHFFEKLRATDDFVSLHEPQCNIVAFRHVPPALRDANPKRVGEFQQKLRRSVIESGEFYLTATPLDGVPALRVTLINPLTTTDTLDELLATLRRHGRQLLAVT